MRTRVLVLAQMGRDAAVISKVLNARGIATTECATTTQLIAQLDEGAAGAVITDDSFVGENVRALKAWHRSQPAWSDFQFIVLTARRSGSATETPVDLLDSLGNFILLERPVNADTLGRAATSAVRARMRQYETQQTMQALDEARATVQALNRELEDRIASRTAALAAANDRLTLEISERERAQASLVHVQKLEAVGRLTGGIAHDFNNLLQIVSMNVELVIRKAKDPKLVELASKAKRAVGRGSKLTSQLLSFARAQSLVPKLIDVNALIAGMQELIAVSIGSRVALQVNLSQELAWAKVDTGQLEMALLNLSVNSKDAMAGGGNLTLSTRLVDGRQSELEASRYVVVSVADTGAGIAPALLSKVFEPFFTTKPLGSGTGLGLSQVYGFARQSGGTARVESQIDVGTVVEMWFPALAPPTPVAEVVSDTSPRQFVARRLLVVEDDSEVRRVIVESLESAGHHVRAASSGAEGLLRIKESRPELLIVDYAMPGMTGAEVIATVRSSDTDMPILLSTGYADMAEVAQVLPATSILLKPFDVSALLEAVDAACKRNP